MKSEVQSMLVKVGDSKALGEGQMRSVDVAGATVCLAKVGGHLYAFDDTCTHMACSLSTGELEGTTVTCPCHGSQFDVTSGALLSGPAERPVRSHLVQLENDEVLVEA